MLNDRANDLFQFVTNPASVRTEFFQNISTLGIIGGLGPVASAKFHYEVCKLSSINSPERNQIRTILLSEPNTPDRTELVLAGDTQRLFQCLHDAVTSLRNLRASHIIIACFTYHCILSDLNSGWISQIVSLVEYTTHIISKAWMPTLVLCSSGSSKLRLFGNSKWLIYPDPVDQSVVHDCITAIKHGSPMQPIYNQIKAIVCKYGCGAVILGCTEFYLLTELIGQDSEPVLINPLAIMAHDIINNWKHSNAMGGQIGVLA